MQTRAVFGTTPGRSIDDRYWRAGMYSSGIVHGFLILILIVGFQLRPIKKEAEKIYSVTLEGGKQLGGISQISSPSPKKEPVAPPRAVSAQQPEIKKQAVEKIAEKNKETAPPDAEVSTSEKKVVEPKKEIPKTKPTPQPTTRPTSVKKPEPTKAPTKPAEPSLAEINKQLAQAMQRYSGESSDARGKGFGAASIGGNGMGGGMQRPPEFFRYRDLVRTVIEGGWSWYDTRAKLSVQVSFQISPQGHISSVRVVSSSGSPEYDDSVLRAIEKANPLPAPPQNVYQYFSSVLMSFDPDR